MDELNNYVREINSLLGESFVNYFLKEGILTASDLRNIKIRHAFKELIAEGISRQRAIQNLSEQPYYTPDGKKIFLCKRTLQRITAAIE